MTRAWRRNSRAEPRRLFLAMCLAISMCAGTGGLLMPAAGGHALAQAPGGGGDGARPRREGSVPGRVVNRYITSALRLSVLRGFNHLYRLQQRSERFESPHPVAVNALVGLAYLAGGYTEIAGPERYARAVRKCTDTLLKFQNPAGYFDDKVSRLYGHGFATLYFAQLYGMTYRPEKIRRALQRAVRLIEISQLPAGGWDYEPGSSLLPRGSKFADTSITVCQMLALRAARNLGVKVDPRVIGRAQQFVASAQTSDGGFLYRPQQRHIQNFSLFPRSAAGVCILYSLGDYNSAAVKRGFEYLQKRYRSFNPYPYYARFYCAQAMFQRGGRYWREYFEYVRGVLLKRQRPDGSWKAGSSEDDVQATAMALIVLQLPYRLLPIHER